MHERTSDRYDVLVDRRGTVGRGGGVLARGARPAVLVVEKKRFPREKTCGDGLTPRAVRQLHDMGLADPLSEFQRFDGLRSIAHGVTLELAWPEHPDFPAYGYVVRRSELDEMVAERAVKAGATLWPARRGDRAGRRAAGSSTARSSGDKDTGATEVVRARYVIVADGANSRFGRALGTAREPRLPARAWRFAAISPARTTTSPGSRATSTSATATGTICPGMGGYFRLATAR